jgi:hypothetical protein
LARSSGGDGASPTVSGPGLTRRSNDANARYRKLAQNTTDPQTLNSIHEIIAELERQLREMDEQD